MSFTYDSTDLSTDLAKVRLEIGDTDSTAPLFTDEEVEVKLDARSNVLLAAADLCDVLATRFSQQYDFETDGQNFKRGQRVAFYADRAKELRKRANGLSSASATRIDAYSDDLSNRDASTIATDTTGRVRRGWFGEDVPH